MNSVPRFQEVIFSGRATKALVLTLLSLGSGCERQPVAQPVVRSTPAPTHAPRPISSTFASDSLIVAQSAVVSNQTSRERSEPPIEPGVLAAKFRDSTEPEERSEIIEKLWETATPAAIETLRQLFYGQRDTDTKIEILSGASEVSTPETQQARIALLMAAVGIDQPADVREMAVHLLTESEDRRADSILRTLAQDQNPEIREAAQAALEERQQ
jgi:hypothetical protein